MEFFVLILLLLFAAAISDNNQEPLIEPVKRPTMADVKDIWDETTMGKYTPTGVWGGTWEPEPLV